MHKAPTSYKTTPEPSTGHKTVAAVPQWYASRFDCYNLAGGGDEPPVPREANIVPFEMRKGMAHMLGEVIALLAMKQDAHRCPFPRHFSKAYGSGAFLRTGASLRVLRDAFCSWAMNGCCWQS